LRRRWKEGRRTWRVDEGKVGFNFLFRKGKNVFSPFMILDGKYWV